MCGIFGYQFKPNAISPGRRAILGASLARFNDLRGGHSWGICSIGEKSAEISRGLGKMGDHVWHLADADFVMAHTRYATIGAKTVENAHPFEIGSIIGAHNGKVVNHEELDKKYGRKVTVDSQHLIHHINENRSFDDVEGYGALEWVNATELEQGVRRVFIGRMLGGMLSVVGIGDPTKDESEGIIWSSDMRHILEALYNAGINNFYPCRVNDGAVYFVRDGNFYLSKRRVDIAKESHNKEPYTYSNYTYNNDRKSGYTNNYSSQSTKYSPPPVSMAQKNEIDLANWKEWNLYCQRSIGNSKE